LEIPDKVTFHRLRVEKWKREIVKAGISYMPPIPIHGEKAKQPLLVKGLNYPSGK
jgi:hypothetical protein